LTTKLNFIFDFLKSEIGFDEFSNQLNEFHFFIMVQVVWMEFRKQVFPKVMGHEIGVLIGILNMFENIIQDEIPVGEHSG
jgi:hypothetical protein